MTFHALIIHFQLLVLRLPQREGKRQKWGVCCRNICSCQCLLVLCTFSGQLWTSPVTQPAGTAFRASDAKPWTYNVSSFTLVVLFGHDKDLMVCFAVPYSEQLQTLQWSCNVPYCMHKYSTRYRDNWMCIYSHSNRYLGNLYIKPLELYIKDYSVIITILKGMQKGR